MNEDTMEILNIMKDLLGNIDSKVNNLSDKVDSMNERIIKIETTQENVTNKNIQLLAEGLSAVIDKVDVLDQMKEDLGSVKIDVKLLNKAVGSHSVKINKLAKIK